MEDILSFQPFDKWPGWVLFIANRSSWGSIIWTETLPPVVHQNKVWPGCETRCSLWGQFQWGTKERRKEVIQELHDQKLAHQSSKSWGGQCRQTCGLQAAARWQFLWCFKESFKQAWVWCRFQHGRTSLIMAQTLREDLAIKRNQTSRTCELWTRHHDSAIRECSVRVSGGNLASFLIYKQKKFSWKQAPHMTPGFQKRRKDVWIRHFVFVVSLLHQEPPRATCVAHPWWTCQPCRKSAGHWLDCWRWGRHVVCQSAWDEKYQLARR